MKLSQKDAKLLILLFSVALLGASYFFGYTKYKGLKQDIDKQILSLDATYKELVIEDRKRAQYEKDIDTNDIENMVIAVNYPAKLTEEKEIMFVTDLVGSKWTGVSSILFSEYEPFYAPAMNKVGILENLIGANGQVTATPVPSASPVPTADPAKTKDDPAATKAPAATPTPTTTNDETAQRDALKERALFTGWRSTMTISYQATYAGLKESIDHIVNYLNRKSIGNLTISFDSATGNLSGDIEITSYALEGFGTTYEDPIIINVPLRLDEPFGNTDSLTGTTNAADATATQVPNTETQDDTTN